MKSMKYNSNDNNIVELDSRRSDRLKKVKSENALIEAENAYLNDPEDMKELKIILSNVPERLDFYRNKV